MPRYWFNVRDGNELLQDDAEGCQHPNLQAVKKDAVLAARQILSAAALTGVAASLQVQIEVVDKAGDTVLIMPVGHATGSESQA
jgi:hypothetical protein